MNNNYIALDCEMVASGNQSLPGRVSLVNASGTPVYDKYVKPKRPVTDYRTYVSGIQPHHLQSGEDFSKVQRDVISLLQGKVLIGHSVLKDLEVLEISHPEKNIRDIANYDAFRRLNTGQPPSLKLLADRILNRSIHNGEHSSLEDAQITMRVYQTVARNWP